MPRKKKRNQITDMCYPREVDVHVFLKEIEIGIEPFKENMENLERDTDKKYIEDWMKIFTNWMEME